MKKTVLTLLLLLTLPTLAVTVTVDGERLPDAPGPLLTQGRVLLPLRQVFQSLQATVDYKDGVVNARRGERTVELRPGDRTATVNGNVVPLDAPARLVNGRTYVPLRFVAQALGEEVAWDGSTKTVAIGETVGQATDLKSRLQQLVVGNQGGILKVREGNEVVFYRGLDDRSTAPLSNEDRTQILHHLKLDEQPDQTAKQLMSSYSTLPKKEAVALLGVLSGQEVQPATKERIDNFLIKVMNDDASVHNRRQAVLALAVGPQATVRTASAVLDFYTGSENLWETFPVQQFFEYQGEHLKTMTEFPQLRSRALSVNSLYRQNIEYYLQ